MEQSTISIGVVVGGRECAFLVERLRSLMRYCSNNRLKGTATADVNIVYHLPGSIVKPNYVGIRTAKLSMEEKTLMIQVGVEEVWIKSTDARKVLRYIYQTADEALGLAKSEFTKRGINYDLESDREFLDEWKVIEGIE